MVVDTSALCAVLFHESDREQFLSIMANADDVYVSTATSVECAIVLLGKLGAEGEMRAREFLERGKFRIVPFDEVQAEIAKRGFQIYGKGRHRAGLNFGDCVAYALAKSLGEPLLFKGDYFRFTDVIPAL
jgi:ribonuclease VapC